MVTFVGDLGVNKELSQRIHRSALDDLLHLLRGLARLLPVNMHFIGSHKGELHPGAPTGWYRSDLDEFCLQVIGYYDTPGTSGGLLHYVPLLGVLLIHALQPNRGFPGRGAQMILKRLHAVGRHLEVGHPSIQWLHFVEHKLLPQLPELPLQVRDGMLLKKLRHRIAVHTTPQRILQSLSLSLQELLLLVLGPLLSHLLAAGNASQCAPQPGDLPLGRRLSHLRLHPILSGRWLVPLPRSGLLLLAGKILHGRRR
mmetsp:Transcript_12235/g.27075  ORF Transcript_12235/g.27075 Transcript_12235/m.27075 type:complete len:255 (-) Transcript_12235:80-844(-)